MESSHFTYLYTLATLAMTFVGFTVIVLVLRQTLGHKLSNFDVLLAHVYMEFGLMISGSSLLPPLLNNWTLPASAVWRLSSALAALPPILYAVTYPARRRAVSGEATPLYVRVNIVIVLSIGIALLSNTFLVPQTLMPAMFLTAMTAFLIFATSTFLQAINVMLKHGPKTRK